MAMQDSGIVERLIDQAHLAMLRRQYDATRSLLEQALALDPGRPAALRLLAQIPAFAEDSASTIPSGFGEGFPATPGAHPEPSYDQAYQIARQAADQERARLNVLSSQNSQSPLSVSGWWGAFGIWDNPNARHSLSDDLLSSMRERRQSLLVRCIVFGFIGAVLFALPPQFGLSYWALNPFVGAAVGMGVAFWSARGSRL